MVNPPSSYKYLAFISYSHHDRRWAAWLHKRLEHYRIPRNLPKRSTGSHSIPRRLFPVFLDKEELAASSNLPDTIKEALRQSKWLIIICSPHSATSHWVNQEVLEFKRLGRGDRILALLVAGEHDAPATSGSSFPETFPPALRFAVGADGEISTVPAASPLAADVRQGRDSKRSALLRLIAAMIGVDLGTLSARDKRQVQRRRLQTSLTVLAAVILAVAAWWRTRLSVEAERQQTLARELALQSDLLRRDPTASLTLAGLLAAESLSRSPTLAGYQSAERFLELLPSRMLSVSTGGPIHSLSVHPERAEVLVLNESALAIYSLENGAVRHRLDLRPLTSDVKVESGKAAFSPDGASAAAIVGDSALLIWRRPFDEPPLRLSHESAVQDFAWRPDARAIAMCSDVGISLQESGPEGEGQNFVAEDSCHKVAIDPTGTYLAASDISGPIRVWKLATGEDVASLGEDLGYLGSLTFSPDGSYLAAADRGGVLRPGNLHLWKVTTWEQTSVVPLDFHASSLGFSPMGDHLVITGNTGWASVFELAQRREVLRLPGEASVNAAQYSNNGTAIVSGGGDGKLRVWESSTAIEALRIPVSQIPYDIRFFGSDDDRLIISGLGIADVWDVRSGTRIRQLEGVVTAVGTTADSKQWAQATTRGGVAVLDSATDKVIGRLAYDKWVGAVDVSPDEIHLATSGFVHLHEDGVIGPFLVEVLNVLEATGHNRGDPIHPFPKYDYSTRVWNLRDGTHRKVPVGPTRAVRFSPDGRFLTTLTTPDGKVTVWNLKSGVAEATFQHDTAQTLAVSPDGVLVATGGSDGGVRLWHSRDGTQMQALEHESAVNDIDFSLDGSHLAVAVGNGTASIWNIRAGSEVVRIRHDDATVSVEFSPDDRYLATGSWDMTARLWLWHARELVELICSRVDRGFTDAEARRFLPEGQSPAACRESGLE